MRKSSAGSYRSYFTVFQASSAGQWFSRSKGRRSTCSLPLSSSIRWSWTVSSSCESHKLWLTIVRNYFQVPICKIAAFWSNLKLFSPSLVLICKSQDCQSCTQLAATQVSKPTIYLITPTYDRHEQLAELTRLSQTLLLVSRLHWIIVEDSSFKTNKIQRFLSNLVLNKKPKFGSDIRIEHLNIKTPDKYKIQPGQPNWSKPKGSFQKLK